MGNNTKSELLQTPFFRQPFERWALHVRLFATGSINRTDDVVADEKTSLDRFNQLREKIRQR